MKDLLTNPKTWEQFKSYLTRKNLEMASAVLILIFALSVLLGRIPTQTTLSWNEVKMTYNGSVVANKLSGHGKLTFENGDTYEGNFKNGVFDGKGTFIAKAGWSYVGEFKKGVADGQGKLTTESNIVYEGTFKQGIYQDAY
ncbi:hypothetical protein D3X11_00835 [Streptococcus sp. X16XC17]|uniref:membrane protein n=1 Tax=unclassified Streptococcus TaxID=2608887 RepID=UPI00066FFB62|nr:MULTISPECIES: membrane protein [unclassified Streptococcus]TCD46057.1 hypothetical protein D3X11_00835 [Streptococcus sp. X16XC17]